MAFALHRRHSTTNNNQGHLPENVDGCLQCSTLAIRRRSEIQTLALQVKYAIVVALALPVPGYSTAFRRIIIAGLT